MEIKKTVGFTAQADIRKSYIIHTECGAKYYANADGSQGYICNGIKYKSVKEIKAAIVDGSIAAESDDEEPADNTTERSTAEGADTWDCVHPCALLIEGLDPKWPTPLKTLTTLDNYGWLDDMGRPDVDRANREIKRVENLEKGN